jgi:hypothetical protein
MGRAPRHWENESDQHVAGEIFYMGDDDYDDFHAQNLRRGSQEVSSAVFGPLSTRTNWDDATALGTTLDSEAGANLTQFDNIEVLDSFTPSFPDNGFITPSLLSHDPSIPSFPDNGFITPSLLSHDPSIPSFPDNGFIVPSLEDDDFSTSGFQNYELKTRHCENDGRVIDVELDCVEISVPRV